MFDVFFFKQKTAYEMRISDWSSDVCSSDLIETVAHNTPDKIHTIVIDPATGLMPHHGRAVAAALALEGDLARQAAKVLAGLYNAFLATDAEQIEINPLAVCEGANGDELLVLHAKLGFDGHPMFRHKDIAESRDLTEEEIGRAHV